MRDVVVLGAMIGFAAGCWRHDPNHCGSKQGDASCPEGMFCDACEPENNGCVAEQPSPTCHVVAVGEDDDVEESSSSGSSTSGDTDATTLPMPTTTDPSGTGTGPQGCTDNEDCSDAGAPFCGATGECVSCEQMSDPDAACQALDGMTPVCSDGACVQCAAEQTSACTGQTPVCNAGNECAPCTEHDHCPDSACHLDGELVGACFDAAEVVEIANTTELSAALDQLGAGGRAVFRLGSGLYSIPIVIGDDAEVAIIGQGATLPILGGGNALNASVSAFGGGVLYLDGVQVSSLAANGVECLGIMGRTTSLWLDDTEVRNCVRYGVETAGECATHLRRTLVAGNDDGGIVTQTGELWIENSVIATNGNGTLSVFGGVTTNTTAVDITYSTLLGNAAMNTARGSLFCLGGESGSIRNSIIAGSGDSIDGCDAITFETNAVDASSLGGSNPNVGPAMAAWFLDLSMDNYRLSPNGATVFADIAMWQEGDPLVDVDGEPIPTMTPSLPGYDQP